LRVPQAGQKQGGFLQASILIANGEVKGNRNVKLGDPESEGEFAALVAEKSGGELTEQSVIDALPRIASALLEILQRMEEDKRDKGAAKDRPGTSLESCVYNPPPCDAPVDGVALAEEIKSIFERHLVLPQGADVALALWVMFTYALDAFDVSPMLFFYSPLPECGKSRALTLIQYLSSNGLMASSISSAGFFRTIEEFTPTICLDEIDTYLRDRDELRGVIN
jgi:hypothetical protein